MYNLIVFQKKYYKYKNNPIKHSSIKENKILGLTSEK